MFLSASNDRAVFHSDDFADRVLPLVTRLDAFNRGHAAFILRTDDHNPVTSPLKTKRKIGGIKLANAIFDWAVAAPGKEGFCVSLTPSNRSWYHFVDLNDYDYVDEGHDSAFLCPGAQF